MFFFTRRRVRGFGLPFFACGISQSLLLGRRLLLAGDRGALRALAGTRVGLGALAVDRQPAAVSIAAVGADLLQALDALGALAAKIALHFAGLHRLAELQLLVLGQVLDVGVRIDPHLFEDLRRRRGPDA